MEDLADEKEKEISLDPIDIIGDSEGFHGEMQSQGVPTFEEYLNINSQKSKVVANYLLIKKVFKICQVFIKDIDVNEYALFCFLKGKNSLE